MPRISRAKSNSGIYHIVVRGINKQDLFYDNEDMGLYLQKLLQYKEECGFEIYAYCMMSNHVHLIIKELQMPLSTMMRKLGTAYVHWYNWKYSRCGHLFQDRFMSEPIEDEQYLLTAIRYVHQNPLCAGMVKELSGYEWSSYNRYVENSSNIVNSEFVLGIFGGVDNFKEFMNLQSNDKCLEISETRRLRDEDVIQLLKDKCNLNNPLEMQTMERGQRNSIISQLKSTSGISFRQIERITGIGRGAIEKVKYTHPRG